MHATHQARTPGTARRPSTVEPEPAVKIAAMLLVGFRGFNVEPGTAADLACGLGSVVLFEHDQLTGGPCSVESPRQLATLTAELRAAALGRLVISTDEEGGRVARLDEVPAHPVCRRVGALNDPAAAETAARQMAETLATAGINLNLAPVVDLALNGTTRSSARLTGASRLTRRSSSSRLRRSFAATMRPASSRR